jgi:hypothetical protein
MRNAVIAVAKGQPTLGRIAATFSEDERKWLLAGRGIQ